ncbi:hypothetical protein [Galbibacter mesophilus]|uniref:hypothetical protein n=1 Tax=Galbibacter mesophilus TaxID=379069 RepID=UPI00192034B8|nr:hypothetical protein [Galbibacter mesophilus]MCM5663020.1 hypothetical protein [Galbibacter mesophilus]
MKLNVIDEKKASEEKGYLQEATEKIEIAIKEIKELAKEKGVVLFETTESPEQRQKEQIARAHHLAIISKQYAFKVFVWFKRNGPLLHSLGKNILDKVELGILEEQDLFDFLGIDEEINTIKRYQHQIHFKLLRALQNDELDLAIQDEIQNDANGSAKVALILTEKSLNAWEVLFDYFKEAQNEILDILVLLKQIQKETSEEFPNAQKFIRPGFDET